MYREGEDMKYSDDEDFNDDLYLKIRREKKSKDEVLDSNFQTAEDLIKKRFKDIKTKKTKPFLKSGFLLFTYRQVNFFLTVKKHCNKMNMPKKQV